MTTGPLDGGRPPVREPKQVVLCFLFREAAAGREVLLGLKKTGFGSGRIVAPGGKIEPGESARQAAAREMEEEAGIRLHERDLGELGTVRWVFPAQPAADMAATIFTATAFTGTAEPSTEIEPQWFRVDEPPYERMWEDARHWLRHVLCGDRLDVVVTLNDDNLTVCSAEFR